MAISSRDDTMPAGWAVRVTSGLVVGGQPSMTMYAVRVSDPEAARELVRDRFDIPLDREVVAIAILQVETFDRLEIAPGDVQGPL